MNILTNPKNKFARVNIEHVDGTQEFQFTFDKKYGDYVYVTFWEDKILYRTTETDKYTREDAENLLNTLLNTNKWKVTWEHKH